MTTLRYLACALLFTIAVPWAAGQSAAGSAPLTIAVFDFSTSEKELNEHGQLLAELSRVQLSSRGALRLVERQDIEEILEEQQLGLAGVTDEAAARVGQLLGAQVLVLGRLFEVNEQLYATAKVIGVETGRVYSEMVKGPQDAIDSMGMELGDKIAALIEQGRETLVAEIQLSGAQLSELREALGGQAGVRTFVYIGEETLEGPVPDPAAQTELIYILRKLGCEVVKDRNGSLARWARGYEEDGALEAPPELDEIDLVLVGNAFSQFASRTGELVSCRARIELEAIEPSSGRVVAIERATDSAVDLSEAIAGKTALQQVAAQAAYRLLPEALATAAPQAGTADERTTGTQRVNP